MAIQANDNLCRAKSDGWRNFWKGIIDEWTSGFRGARAKVPAHHVAADRFDPALYHRTGGPGNRAGGRGVDGRQRDER